MAEIYWITRLGPLHVVGWILLSAGVLILFLLIPAYLSGFNEDEDAETFKLLKKIAIISFIVGGVIHTFIPTTKEFIAIWGIGSTIEYLESNEKAKQLPDKCVKALEKFADEYLSEEE